MDTAPIAVTGGTGALGSAVVTELVRRGHRPRVLSRGVAPNDLPAGRDWARINFLEDDDAALARAFHGATTVVHCATTLSGRGDVRVAERMLAACAAAGIEHFVLVSIVGIDRVSMPYYRGKLEVERLVKASGIPATIQRATQFHDLARMLFVQLARLPFLPVPDLMFQPVSVQDVAPLVAELAVGPPQGRTPDAAGPRVECTTDLARAFVEAAGVRRRVVPVRLPGFLQVGAPRAIAQGGLLPEGAGPRGTATFADYLTEHPDLRSRSY